MPEPTHDATRYVLLMLLQRMEKLQPGLLAEMSAGVAADREGATGASAHATAVFASAAALLDQAAEPERVSGRPRLGDRGRRVVGRPAAMEPGLRREPARVDA